MRPETLRRALKTFARDLSKGIKEIADAGR